MANPSLLGKWTSYKSENLETVFSAMGLSWMAKKLGGSINVTVRIEASTTDTEDQIKLSVKSLFLNTAVTLDVGGIISWNGGASTVMDCFTCWEDGKLVVYMGDTGTDPKLSGRRQIRELLPDSDEMLLTIHWNEIEAKRWYRRVTS